MEGRVRCRRVDRAKRAGSKRVRRRAVCPLSAHAHRVRAASLQLSERNGRLAACIHLRPVQLAPLYFDAFGLAQLAVVFLRCVLRQAC
eukprot:926990-Rhodomonas_salina.1